MPYSGEGSRRWNRRIEVRARPAKRSQRRVDERIGRWLVTRYDRRQRCLMMPVDGPHRDRYIADRRRQMIDTVPMTIAEQHARRDGCMAAERDFGLRAVVPHRAVGADGRRYECSFRKSD